MKDDVASSRAGTPAESRAGAGSRLNVFCSRRRTGYTVHLRPADLSPGLEPYFDRHFEAEAPALDFEELDRRMASQGLACEKVVAKTGSVELTANGPAAAVLTDWLLTAFGSGVRPRAGRSPG
jgi:hypothetical protein